MRWKDIFRKDYWQSLKATDISQFLFYFLFLVGENPSNPERPVFDSKLRPENIVLFVWDTPEQGLGINIPERLCKVSRTNVKIPN